MNVHIRLMIVGLLAIAAPAAAQSQIQPAAVKVAGSPNVLAWPVTTRIARLELADQGVRVTFDKCATWPDVTPPGWGGPLRFTLWLFENIGGEWYAAGIIQFWACDQFNGGAVYQDHQIARNWVYDTRWSAMVGHQPAPGERIGFMVSAGNARGEDDHGVAERSDIVELLMPTAAATYPPAPFAAVEGVYVPPPIVTPPPVVVAPPPVVVVPPAPPVPVPSPAPLPATDLSPVLGALASYQASLNAQLADLRAQLATAAADVQAFRAEVEGKWAQYIGPILKYGGAIVVGILAKWKLAPSVTAQVAK